ncbi:hypothetical protein CDCA_CDCA17G4452 [Cyanidium caldarium]|uniref:Uncharacterized protein n=1 Tax=Cyanidium caldarium TaxID=2771 RepID=A0AAV9J1D7_CYACA|nr:hypothetical protein CDCA_CDCA17G4452 [Cyanidium caldarium]
MYSDESSIVSFVGQPAWRALRTSGRGAGHGAASAFRRPSSPALHVRRSLCRVAWRMLGGVGGGGGGMRPWNKPGAPVGGTPDNVIQPAREDVLLGQLVYMEPELLPKYIESNMEEFDEDFYKFVEQKIENSQDLEERVTLRTLLEAITDLMKQLLDEKAPPADAKARPEANGADGAAPAASAIASSSGGTAAAPIGTSEQRKMLEALLALHDSADRLQVAVETNYERFDAHFLEYLSKYVRSSEPQAAGAIKVLEAINMEMKRRMERAARNLQQVLHAGGAAAISAKLRQVGGAGGIDEAFCLLLEANIQEASKANAAPEIVKMLETAKEEAAAFVDEAFKDKELRLVRQLLRTDDEEKRRQILFTVLSPKEKVYLPEGSDEDQPRMEIDPRRFLEILRELIAQFGNVDEKIVARCREISEQAEAVAREILDLVGKDVKTLQDESWMRTLSVYELERMEVQADMEGRKMPWQQPRPQGFDEHGRREL